MLPCGCETPTLDGVFGLVEPEGEALLIIQREDNCSILRAFPHESSFFMLPACNVQSLAKLLPAQISAVLEGPLRATARDGSPRTVVLSAHPGSDRVSHARLALGEEGVYVLLRDIGFSICRIESDANDAFWSLFDLAPIPMLISCATDSRAIRAARLNRRFTELFGYTVEDVPTVQQWWPLAYPDEGYRNMIREEWSRRLAQASSETPEAILPMHATVHCKDGSQRDVEIGAASIGEAHIVTFLDLTERNVAQRELAKHIDELQEAIAQLKILRGLLPLCAWCKKVRDDKGYWRLVEEFFEAHTDLSVTHSICPECRKMHFR